MSSGSGRISESFVIKSINIEGGFFLWRMEFFKIGKRDFTFIREMRVLGIYYFGLTFDIIFGLALNCSK